MFCGKSRRRWCVLWAVCIAGSVSTNIQRQLDDIGVPARIHELHLVCPAASTTPGASGALALNHTVL